jgi:anhydro-N-acetylmuramic acid kinase
MNKNIEKLYSIAKKEERIIIGLMSGTSMDGLDVALCSFKGSGPDTEVKVLNFETVSFDESVKEEIRKVFAKPVIEFEQLCLLNPWIGNMHGDIVNQCLKTWGIAPEEVDCIASHGQTVFHSPKILHKREKFPNATLQIGDGDHMAVRTQIITLSDFRQKHCAAGGEGAPLAVYGDYLILSKKGEDRILLNMGGISNFTILYGDLDPNKVFATDTGTGNTLLDAFVNHHYQIAYDKDANLSKQGLVNAELLKELKQDDFFEKPFPKTTGPELFNLGYLENAQKRSKTEEIRKEDVLATLCRFSAETIAEALKKTVEITDSTRIYMSGGGMHNPLLVQFLKELLPAATFSASDEIGVLGDAKEAVLFATLANEALAGGTTNFGSRRGVPSVSMGKISFPD